MNALDQWWKELREGKRKETAPLDTLWRAACAQKHAEDHWRWKIPIIAEQYEAEAEALRKEYNASQ